MRLKPVNVIKLDLGIDAGGKVQKFFTDTCAIYMDKYIPMDTGNLRDNITKGATYITYESPYAHAQYVGMVHGLPIQNYTTAGTGPYWDERMKSADMDVIVKKVQDYVRKKGNR